MGNAFDRKMGIAYSLKIPRADHPCACILGLWFLELGAELKREERDLSVCSHGKQIPRKREGFQSRNYDFSNIDTLGKKILLHLEEMGWGE